MKMFKLQYCIILSVCLYSRFSYGFPHELLCNGAKIITYGEPCYQKRYLSAKIEESIPPIEAQPSLCKAYQPLKLDYQVIFTEPVYHRQTTYPISVEIPQVPQPSKIVAPDSFREKSYEYNIQLPHRLTRMPMLTNYNFDVQVPVAPSTTRPQCNTSKFLTNLTSKIDKILIPACEVPSLNCKTCETTNYFG